MLFTTLPSRRFFNNHASTIKHSDFVSEAITKLVSSVVLVEVGESDLTVCSHLSVAKKFLENVDLFRIYGMLTNILESPNLNTKTSELPVIYSSKATGSLNLTIQAGTITLIYPWLTHNFWDSHEFLMDIRDTFNSLFCLLGLLLQHTFIQRSKRP